VSRLSRWIKEPFCGVSHFVGALLAIAALVVLLVLADGRFWHVLGFSVYGTTLILLYTASTLCHSVHCAPRTAKRLDKLDHFAIFLLIAGTYTPICLVALRGPLGWTLLALEWCLAAIGIVILSRGPVGQWPRVIIYVAMSWLVLIAVGPVWRALTPGAIAWLIAGGIVYTGGAVVYAMDRPHLWPGKFLAHDLWHVFVLIGSACHFAAMLSFV
jgi:hemolysin III